MLLCSFVPNFLANTLSETFRTHSISHGSVVEYINSCDTLRFLYKSTRSQSMAFTANVGEVIVNTHTVFEVGIDFTFKTNKEKLRFLEGSCLCSEKNTIFRTSCLIPLLHQSIRLGKSKYIVCFITRRKIILRFSRHFSFHTRTGGSWIKLQNFSIYIRVWATSTLNDP